MQENVTLFVTITFRKIKCEAKLSYIDIALKKAQVSLFLSNPTASTDQRRSENHEGKLSGCSFTPLLCLVVSQLFFTQRRRVFGGDGPQRLWLQMTSLYCMAWLNIFHWSEWEDNIFKQQTELKARTAPSWSSPTSVRKQEIQSFVCMLTTLWLCSSPRSYNLTYSQCKIWICTVTTSVRYTTWS